MVLNLGVFLGRVLQVAVHCHSGLGEHASFLSLLRPLPTMLSPHLPLPLVHYPSCLLPPLKSVATLSVVLRSQNLQVHF
jgi:hypothetical protein